MKKAFGRSIAWVLSVVMIFCTSLSAAAAEVIPASYGNDSANESGSFSAGMGMRNTDDLSELIGQEFSQEQARQQESLGNYIYSVKVTDNVATVDFKTTMESTIVVGLYDEEGNKMFTSGSADVDAGQTSVSISFDQAKMPQYFYIKAFMVEKDSFKPLGKVYESPNYTRSMIEFFSKTTDDFSEDQVLNLDEDKTNIQIPQSRTVNHVVSVDEKNDVYVFENINTSVSSLKKGDIFVCHDDDNALIIVKVSAVAVNGKMATINGEDTSLEEVFQYVRIDTYSDLSDAVIDNSGLSEGVTQHEEEEPKTTSTSASAKSNVSTESESNKYLDIDFWHGKLEAGVSETKGITYDFDEEISESAGEETGHGNLSAKINVKGNVTLQMTLSMKLYLQIKGEKYIEFKTDYLLSTEVHISAEVKYRVRIGRLEFMPIECVNVVFEPYFEFEAQVQLDASFKVTGTVGFRASESNGLENITTKPECEPSVHAEGRLYIGLDLQPSINIIDEKVAKAYLSGKIGVEVKLTLDLFKQTENIRHECVSCTKGNLNFLYSLTIGARLLDDDKYDWSKTLLDKSIPIGEFYYSDDFHELGWGKCPHQEYKCNITVYGVDGQPVSGALINNTYGTDPQGKVDIFLKPGKNTLTAVKDNVSASQECVIDSPKAVVIRFKKSGSDSQGGNYDPFEGDDPFANYFSQLEVSVKDVQMNGATTAVITSNNTLYMFGYNANGQVGCGSTDSFITAPRKIMDNVKMVDLGYDFSIALTTNGDLYTWGYNGDGRLGDGTNINSSVPIKIMSNVISASAGGNSAYAVTKDGNLYAWGSNEYGQLGNGTTVGSNEPQKIMKNISFVCTESAAVVTNDGVLYTFGHNYYGELGVGMSGGYYSVPFKVMTNVMKVYANNNGDKERYAIITNTNELYCWGWDSFSIGSGSIPVKIMDDIVSADIFYHSAALTKSGELYLWGYNGYGAIGNGIFAYGSFQDKPIKIMDNVVAYSLGGEYSAAVTRSGELYTWGLNEHGNLGNGTFSDVSTPQKIMDNCAKVFAGGSCTAVATYDNGHVDSYLYTFGSNGSGQLGNGTTTDQSKPVRITLSSGKSTSTSAGTGTPTALTKTYEGLEPKGIYNFYVMKSRTELEPLASENLYYISQETADEDGMLSITYTPTEAYETADRFLVAMDKVSISNADAEISDLIYTGEEQFVEPVITLDDLELTEGVDYELTGDYAVTDDGEYTVIVNGIGRYSGTLSLNYTVIKEFLNRSDIDRDLILLGDEITITANAVGGTGGYRYDYYFRLLSDPYWSVLDVNSSDTELAFEPYKAGQYYIRVDARDSSGSVKHKAMILDVKSRSLVNTSTVSATKIYTGSQINITCSAQGGTGSYQYGVYYKDVFDNKWITAQKYGNNTMLSIPFNAEGLYDLCVKVRDSSGAIVKQYYSITVEDEKILPLKSKSSISQTTIKLGDNVTIKAAASGGKGSYTYAAYYKTSNDDAWTVLQSFDINSTLTFTPEQQTVYDICVKVKDETSKVVKKYFTLKVVSPILANVSKLSSTSIDLGQTVTLMGGGSGGDAPYTYAFLYRKEGASSWSLLGTKYGTASTETYTPKAEDTYDIRINVRDATGTIAIKEFKLTVIERLDPLVNNSTLSAESIAFGESVKVTASATGGKPAYTYAFYYRRVGTEKWTKSGTEFGTAKTATIKPAKAVDYEVRVVIKDSKENTAEKIMLLSVQQPSPLENTSTISNTDGTAKVGTAITINGSATGGSGTYKYAYYFKKSALTDWHVIGTEFTTKTTSSHTPTTATSYDIKVVVKDGAGTTSEKIFTVKASK